MNDLSSKISTTPPGPSWDELAEGDSREVPSFLRGEAWQDLGAEPLSVDRYVSGDFFARECEKMWPEVWQFVARVEEMPQPGDYVLATGENHSVREFVELAFKQVGRNIVWRGAGLEETGIDAQSGDSLVAVDPKFFRPTELSGTLGDATRARSVLGWKTRVSFPSLVNEMVEADILRLESGRLIQSTASD